MSAPAWRTSWLPAKPRDGASRAARGSATASRSASRGPMGRTTGSGPRARRWARASKHPRGQAAPAELVGPKRRSFAPGRRPRSSRAQGRRRAERTGADDERASRTLTRSCSEAKIAFADFSGLKFLFLLLKRPTHRVRFRFPTFFVGSELKIDELGGSARIASQLQREKERRERSGAHQRQAAPGGCNPALARDFDRQHEAG